MKLVGGEVEGTEDGIGDLDAGGVALGVEACVDGEASGGAGVRDQVEDHLVGLEGAAAPVVGDVAEHAVLDLVPFAGAGRVVGTR